MLEFGKGCLRSWTVFFLQTYQLRCSYTQKQRAEKEHKVPLFAAYARTVPKGELKRWFGKKLWLLLGGILLCSFSEMEDIHLREERGLTIPPKTSPPRPSPVPKQEHAGV